MTKLVSLHNNAHQNMRVDPLKAEAHGANLPMVPVMLSEFLKLAVQYPIVVSKNKDTGQFVCVAMFGFSTNENLFWSSDGWEGIYTPLHVARQPFFLGQDKGQFLVCFDADSESISDAEGEALFNDDGSESNFLKSKQAVLAELLAGEEKIKSFVDKLLSLNLLKALQLEITFDNGESQRVNGMYAVDEDVFNALDDNILLELKRLEYLRPIYAMIVSMGQIYSLVQKRNLRLSLESAPNAVKTA